MIDDMQKALILKDIKGITSNKRMFSVLLIVPLVLTLMLPTVLILSVAFIPTESSDFQALLNALPDEMKADDPSEMIIRLIFNNIMPLFFLLVPIMSASVMAASSFVGEKEKRTLETLLYSPLSLGKIFQAKIAASFLMSMIVSLISFAAMMLVLEIELSLVMGQMFAPDISWLILMLLVSPGVSLIAITIIVRGSAKAQTVEESQQRSAFLILPIMLLAAGQFTGLLLVSPLILLALGVALTAVAFFALRSCSVRFTYEALLR